MSWLTKGQPVIWHRPIRGEKTIVPLQGVVVRMTTRKVTLDVTVEGETRRVSVRPEHVEAQ